MNINYIVKNIDAVKALRPKLQESIRSIETALNAGVCIDQEQLKQIIKNISNYKKIDTISVQIPSPVQAQLIQAQADYNKCIDELDAVRSEYDELHANSDAYFSTYSADLIGSLFGEFANRNNIIYDDDLGTFIDKVHRKTLDYQEIFTLFGAWLSEYIHYLQINFDNLADPIKSIAVVFPKYDQIIDGDKLLKRMGLSIADYAVHEHYMQGRIKEVAQRYDGHTNYINGFGQAFLGLENTTITNDAMRIWLAYPFMKIMHPDKYENFSILLNAKGATGKSFITKYRLDPALKNLFGDILKADNFKPVNDVAKFLSTDTDPRKAAFQNNIYPGLSDWNIDSGKTLIDLLHDLNEENIEYRIMHTQVVTKIKMLAVPFLTVNQDTIRMNGLDDRRILKLKSIDPAVDTSVITDIKKNYKYKYLDPLAEAGLFEKIIEQVCWMSVNCKWEDVFSYDEKGNNAAKDDNNAASIIHIAVSFAKFIIEKPNTRLDNNVELKIITSRLQEHYDEFKEAHKSIATWTLPRLMKNKEFSNIFKPKMIKIDNVPTRVRTLNPSNMDEYEAKLSAIIDRDGVFINVNTWPVAIVKYYNMITGANEPIPSFPDEELNLTKEYYDHMQKSTTASGATPLFMTPSTIENLINDAVNNII